MIDLEKKQELLQNVNMLSNYITEFACFTSCLDCVSWDLKGDKCKKYNTKPPATTIVQKCEAFELDIPF